MKQTTMQLHQVSTNGIDTWHTVPAYLVPGTTTWYVVKAEDETRATQGDALNRSDAFGLFHDGLAAARFVHLHDAIDAGQRAAWLWDKPGLPKDTAGSIYQELVRIMHTAQGQWWNK